MSAPSHARTMSANVLIYSVGTVLTRVAGFVLLPFYTWRIPVADYGTLGVLQTTQTLVTVLCGLGLTNALSRIYYDDQGPDAKRLAISTVSWTVLGGTATASILALAGAGLYNRLAFGGALPWPLLRLLLLSFVPLQVMGVGMALLQIKIRPALSATLQVLHAVVYHSLAISLLRGGAGLGGVLGAGIAAAAVVGACLFFFLRADLFPPAARWNVLRPLLHSGLPLLCIGLIAWLLDVSDRFFLNHFVSAAEVGIYGLANQIVTVVGFVNTVFMQAVPIYLYRVREGDRALGERLQTGMLRYYLFVALLVGLGISLLAPGLVRLLAPSSYAGAHRFVPALVLSQVILGCFYVLHIGIANAKRFHLLIHCFLAAGLTNLACNFLLIPRFAGQGAAAATALSYLVLMTVAAALSQRVYPMAWERREALLLVLIAAGCFAGGTFTVSADTLLGLGGRLLWTALFVPLAWRAGLTPAERRAVVAKVVTRFSPAR